MANRLEKSPVAPVNGNENRTTVTERVVIPAPNIQVGSFNIVGTTPYLQNCFSAKAAAIIHETQEAGPTAKKGRKREAKDFQACYEASMYSTKEGWRGIPAMAFKAACVRACNSVGFHMTKGKIGFFVEVDGYSSDGKTGLVRITKGESVYDERPVRLETGVCDIRARALWSPGWEATVRIKFDGDMFSLMDIAHLLARAGFQVGIGEGRPSSPNSCGLGFGLFEVRG